MLLDISTKYVMNLLQKFDNLNNVEKKHLSIYEYCYSLLYQNQIKILSGKILTRYFCNYKYYSFCLIFIAIIKYKSWFIKLKKYFYTTLFSCF